MLDSPEGVCAGQVGFEYPATSVPFSMCSRDTARTPLVRGWVVTASFSTVHALHHHQTHPTRQMTGEAWDVSRIE